MLKAEKLKDYDPKKFRPGYVSPKYNGIHGIYEKGCGHLYSRTPKAFDGLWHLEQILDDFPMSVVGEVVIPGVPFQEASGLIRSSHATPEACFYIFNCFDTHWPDVTFAERYDALQDYYKCNETRLIKNQVFLIEPAMVHTTHEFDLFYDQALHMGHEGVCWIAPDHVYQPGKRGWNWMKRVPLKSIEATVEEILPGTLGKKYEHSLGRLVCRMDDGNIVKVGIFKGHSDSWRQHIYDTREEYIGARVTIVFKDYSAKGIPVQPRFKEFRWDL